MNDRIHKFGGNNVFSRRMLQVRIYLSYHIPPVKNFVFYADSICIRNSLCGSRFKKNCPLAFITAGAFYSDY